MTIKLVVRLNITVQISHDVQIRSRTKKSILDSITLSDKYTNLTDRRVVSSPSVYLPSPLGGSNLFCWSLLEEDDDDDDDRFSVCACARTANRSFSISSNFLLRASISWSLRRSSTCTSLKPSSQSLLISTTAAFASISMMEVNLLWKATQPSMAPPLSTCGSGRDVANVELTFLGWEVRLWQLL